ncbi:MAG: ComEA family DNA-binding protein [Pyrinomonadaceae bacterium]
MMNKWPGISFALLAALTLSGSACVKRARANLPPSRPSSELVAASNQDQPRKININTAPAVVLESLPGIGKALAARIIEHREKYGPFRRVEHLIIVRGISDRRFRELRDLVTVQ